jgi:hypothetical protein
VATPATPVGVTRSIRTKEAVMVATIAIVLGGAVILMVVVPWLLKGVAEMEKDIEDHMLDPGTPKVVYVVPDGIDAAVVRTALDLAGFSSQLDIVGGEERLLIECQELDRERVREVIADGVQSAYARSGLTIGAVTFRDD